MSWEQSLREEYMEYKDYRAKIRASYSKLQDHFEVVMKMVSDDAFLQHFKFIQPPYLSSHREVSTIEPMAEPTPTGATVCLYVKHLGEHLLAVDLKCAEYMAEAEAFKMRYYEMAEQNARLEEANSKLMEELVRLQEMPK